jgi:enamine deaminase RidA (YjgF/YER057c/UK114 family)
LILAAAQARELRADELLKSIEANPALGISEAVVVGTAPLLHTTQIFAWDKRGEILGKGDVTAQVRAVLENLGLLLAEGESGFEHCVKLNFSVTGPDGVAEITQALARVFRGGVKPAVSFVAGKLPHPDALVALDAVAVTAIDPGATVRRGRCKSLSDAGNAAHFAVLPAGPKVYISGQAEKGNLADATRRTLESLRATLKHLGLSDADVVQVKAFVQPMAAIGEVEQELARFYGPQQVPPVAFVEWISTLPIEIEIVAAGGRRTDPPGPAVSYITPPGMQASPIFCRVTRIDSPQTIYISGLYGTAGASGEAQTEEIFATLGRLLKSTGSDFRHLAKATYYVSDDEASRKLNDLRPKFYDPQRPPAASKAQVPGVGRAGRTITLDMIAVPAR